MHVAKLLSRWDLRADTVQFQELQKAHWVIRDVKRQQFKPSLWSNDGWHHVNHLLTVKAKHTASWDDNVLCVWTWQKTNSISNEKSWSERNDQYNWRTGRTHVYLLSESRFIHSSGIWYKNLISELCTVRWFTQSLLTLPSLPRLPRHPQACWHRTHLLTQWLKQHHLVSANRNDAGDYLRMKQGSEIRSQVVTGDSFKRRFNTRSERGHIHLRIPNPIFSLSCGLTVALTRGNHLKPRELIWGSDLF